MSELLFALIICSSSMLQLSMMIIQVRVLKKPLLSCPLCDGFLQAFVNLLSVSPTLNLYCFCLLIYFIGGANVCFIYVRLPQTTGESQPLSAWVYMTYFYSYLFQCYYYFIQYFRFVPPVFFSAFQGRQVQLGLSRQAL